MKKLFKTISFIPLFFLSLPGIQAEMNFWRHPEIAGRNSVFADIGIAPVMFDGFVKNFENFNFLPFDIRVEYFPPLPLPFSFGIFAKTPNPNLKSFGLRAAYHFGLFGRLTDFYLAYSFDLGFFRNRILAEYNDAPAPVNFFDFRVGVRRFFGPLIGVAVETGFKFESVIFLVSIKIN